MFTWFVNMALLDQILIIVFSVSLLAKWIGDLTSWHVCKQLNRDKNGDKQCIYLDTDNDHECRLEVYNKKYFVNHKCDKIHCAGYRTSSLSIDELKTIYKGRFLFLTIIKWISEISTFVLIIRTLIISYSIVN